QVLEQLVGAFGHERIDLYFPEIRLAAPSVAILRAIIDEQQEPGGRPTVDEVVENCLCFGVDPVQILEYHHDRLRVALTNYEQLDGLLRALATLRGVKRLPRRVLQR